MKFKQRLPHSLKETVLFMAIISILSVNTIAPIITGLEIGFSFDNYKAVLHQIPLLWIFVIIMVILTQKPTQFLVSKILKDHDNSFEATMIITALCNVFLMSLVLSVVGTWIGTSSISIDPIVHFFEKWPRNFTIAFIIEAFFAQPIARSVMARYHAANELA
ncbi:hypothetical protein [Mycoplasma sp. P36-A1]|uniref:hypothetical protein n=1 Tax=Mycoplasma sp. P36-A1 TaxID=3252900 RepID=UPI003C308D3C